MLYQVILEESFREIYRNKYNFIFSTLILTVLATIYFTSLSYSLGVFNSQKNFYANNPVYAILGEEVEDSDEKFIQKLLVEEFKTEQISKVREKNLPDSFWKELGISKKEMRALDLAIPTIMKIEYSEIINALEINGIIQGFLNKSSYVKSFVYNDEGFKASAKLWNRAKSHAVFYIVSSVFSLIFFVIILMCFLALNKKANLRVLDYLGASDIFSLFPLCAFAFCAFILSGFFGLIFSVQTVKVFGLPIIKGYGFYLYLSYLLVFLVCYAFFPILVQRLIRNDET